MENLLPIFYEKFWTQILKSFKPEYLDVVQKYPEADHVMKQVDRVLKDIVTWGIDYRRGFGSDIGFIDHWRIVTTSNYKSLAELHTPNIILTTARIKSSKSSLAVSWQRILTQ
jgi:hypothetical protein